MRPQVANAGALLNWPEALTDLEAFRIEQERLSGVWTFLGFAQDLAKDGDWLRATIATRSVFVQRFGANLRGFENRCAHRSFPLRTADKGHGPIVCGFHHWRYDENGQAIGIPQSIPLFGGSPRELSAHLNPIEIDTCGALIFGRFAPAGDNRTLRQFLGEGFDILAAISDTPTAPQCISRTIEANWRICFHANAEDYHPFTVHPGTFGKEGPFDIGRANYYRFGWHSAFFFNQAPDGLTKMAAACRERSWRSENYRVFHIFPDLTVSHLRVHWENWYIVVVQYAPVTATRSAMRAWFYPAPFPTQPPTWYDRLTRPLSNLIRKVAMSYFVGMVLGEDDAVSVRLQSNAPQLSNAPILGALEERLAWFEQAYAELMRTPQVR
jgi:phenylpropionate dioxygenase-like ring-hydroxylating dioxygenase large terminal subunit